MMELSVFSDEYFMKQAYQEALLAQDKGEVPVGAVIVFNNRIIARAHNMTEHLGDFTAHAEMQAFTSAADFLGNKYLDKCTLYVTLEPCVMCAGASFWTRIGRIVYGAADLKRGYQEYADNILHPKTVLCGGVMEKECGILLTNFFKNRRKSPENPNTSYI